MSHTPGKWTAECVGCTDGENPTDVYEITSGYARIAEYVADRDAHLLAAAPELLEALKAIVNFTDLEMQDGDAARALARAAIDKAEGK